MYCTAMFHLKSTATSGRSYDGCETRYIVMDNEDYDGIVAATGRQIITDAYQHRHMIDIDECAAISRGPDRYTP